MDIIITLSWSVGVAALLMLVIVPLDRILGLDTFRKDVVIEEEEAPIARTDEDLDALLKNKAHDLKYKAMDSEAKEAKAIARDKLRWVDELLDDEQRDWVDLIVKGLDMEQFPLVVKEGVLFGGEDYIESQLVLMDENKRVQKEVLAAKKDPEKVRGIIDESMLQMGSLMSGRVMQAQSHAQAQIQLQQGLAQSQANAHLQRGLAGGVQHGPPGPLGIAGILGFQ